MIDFEPLWKRLEICEADLARLKAQGGADDEMVKAVTDLRATIKELQRADRAKLPDEPPWASKAQRRQEDADWLTDGWSRR
jgi:hypothetical protein